MLWKARIMSLALGTPHKSCTHAAVLLVMVLQVAKCLAWIFLAAGDDQAKQGPGCCLASHLHKVQAVLSVSAGHDWRGAL